MILPLLAKFTFEGGAGTYAALVVAMGAGSVVGALTAGARGRVSPALLVGASAAFGLATVLAAVAPTLPLTVAALALVGAASVTFAAGVNSTLQLEVAPEMRGRVMALYSVVFLGSTPIGGPLAGWVAQAASPRAALMLGAAAALVAAGGAAVGHGRAAGIPAVRRGFVRGSRLAPPHTGSPRQGRGQRGPPRGEQDANHEDAGPGPRRADGRATDSSTTRPHRASTPSSG